ncbi:MAG: phosphoenolpyruvate--protein phosphotransferase [Clostridia bacterium]|nr:phosphoenolpyruvate--protein phosphotransferase [Clostridia bacterium]
MEVFYGKGVSDGCCIGAAAILHSNRAAVKNEPAASPEDEWHRYLTAREQLIARLDALCRQSAQSVGEENADIFAIHAMMAQDEDFNREIERAIREHRQNAAYAVSQAARGLADTFSHMDSAYMRERATDVRDVAEGLIRLLQGEHAATDTLPDTPYVLCADDLTPGQTATLDRSLVLGFATARGSLTSHTAILARSMGLPALVGLGTDAIAAIRDGDPVAIDGQLGTLILCPDAETVARLQQQQQAQSARAARLQHLRHTPTRTADGTSVKLYANAGTPKELEAVLACGGEGIGLLRSEFLYLDRTAPPDEEEQLAAYRHLLENMGGKPVIIRTLDIGADKQVSYLPRLEHEENPALGCRAVRYSLTHPNLFLTQARALLRAGEYGDLSVMFPLITAEQELRDLLRLWQQAEEQLRDRGYHLSKRIPIGIMIETPAAALISDTLAPMVDFFSIGTNDLTQYTLAMDRQNSALLPFLQPHHPAVLSLIRMTIANAKRAGIWVGVCGELAADPVLTEQLLRMGVDELSVSPPLLLSMREHISHIRLSTSHSLKETKKEISHATKDVCHS